MEILLKSAIESRMGRRDDKALFVEPLLENSQIGEISLDLRLGTDFLVSVLTRRAVIGLQKTDEKFRGIASYFRQTRRDIGDRFILYPGQIALGTTLEYIGLPLDVYADLLSRSSYLRLGIPVSSMIQPGYRGCFPIELFNHGNSPVELVIGSRLIQARLFQIQETGAYEGQPEKRKYIGNVRPIASRAADDSDLRKLTYIAQNRP